MPAQQGSNTHQTSSTCLKTTSKVRGDFDASESWKQTTNLTLEN